MKKFVALLSVLMAVLVFGACSEDLTSQPPPEAVAVDPIETDPEPEPDPEPRFSVEQEQAIGSAESYLDFGSFSKKGLIEQLEYEGYPDDVAAFAVEQLDVDWKKQAAKSAETYLEFSNYSREGLIEQLEYEGFTTKQAEYGADQVGL